MNVVPAGLLAAGFDLSQEFDARAAAREPGWECLAAGADRGLAVGVMIGNTRALWPPFAEALRGPALAGQADPLDRYTVAAIAAAFPGAPSYFTHQRYDGAFLPFSRLADAIGLAALAPSHLVIHPVYGPWISLRAVVLLPGAPPIHARIPRPCICDRACTAALERAHACPADGHAWLAVREACSLQAHRFSDAQIAFHYRAVFAQRPI